MIVGIGENGNLRLPAFQGRQDRSQGPAMQADHAGIVPAFLDSRKGQSDGTHVRQKKQFFLGKSFEQPSADAEKKRIAGCQDDGLLLSLFAGL